ncbi:small glutamine-rich tetratricopeptide repeat-containing protein alpha-like isoform X2 [Bacillus rossius redtenbacheri]|uniref:small glutamine-rich tetratricopeptide repeat-containing protein alpha-like isoform X2 n=1 Tax=Bacillus rossius redtenbacheri TaxID=93214 RepID=UPI002FDCAF26
MEIMMSSNTTKKNNIQIIIDYLRNDIRSGGLEGESCESIEVAIECLQNAYGISRDSTEDVKKAPRSFFEQFEKFLNSYGDGNEHEHKASSLSFQADPLQKSAAEKLKEDGNSSMKQGDYIKALDLYTKAIQVDNSNAVYYCNRAAAYMKLEDHHSAISDCNTALRIDPHYSKAYARLGMAYTSLKNYKKAKEYYQKALTLEPNNSSYQNNVKTVDEMLNLAQPPNLPPPFNNPDLFAFAQEMFQDPSMNVLGRRLAEQLYPEIARQLGGEADQSLLPPRSPGERKQD